MEDDSSSPDLVETGAHTRDLRSGSTRVRIENVKRILQAIEAVPGRHDIHETEPHTDPAL